MQMDRSAAAVEGGAETTVMLPGAWAALLRGGQTLQQGPSAQ